MNYSFIIGSFSDIATFNTAMRSSSRSSRTTMWTSSFHHRSSTRSVLRTSTTSTAISRFSVQRCPPPFGVRHVSFIFCHAEDGVLRNGHHSLTALYACIQGRFPREAFPDHSVLGQTGLAGLCAPPPPPPLLHLPLLFMHASHYIAIQAQGFLVR